MVKIIIAGGGLGGLLLANKLAKEQSKTDSKIEVVVLERDESPNAREQGVVIGLSQKGLDAMNSVHGLEDISKRLFAPHGAKDLVLQSSNSTTLVRARNVLQVKLHDGTIASGLIPRGELRKQLAMELPDGVIRWNSKVVDVEEIEGCVTVTLSSGECVDGDILIGADGARSHVREKFFPKLMPNSLGLYTFWLLVPESDWQHFGNDSKLLREAKKALTRTSGKRGCSVLSFVFYPSNKEAEAQFFWVASMPNTIAAPLMISGLSGEDFKRKACGVIKEHFDDADITKAMDISKAIFPGYELTSVLPELYKEALTASSTSRVTVLGDAAHKTTTQAGLGATAAFEDAIDLGAMILKFGDAITPQHLREYEARMSKRAQSVVGMSLGNTQMIHKVRGPVGTSMVNGLLWTIGCIISTVQVVKSLVT